MMQIVHEVLVAERVGRALSKFGDFRPCASAQTSLKKQIHSPSALVDAVRP